MRWREALSFTSNAPATGSAGAGLVLLLLIAAAIYWRDQVFAALFCIAGSILINSVAKSFKVRTSIRAAFIAVFFSFAWYYIIVNVCARGKDAFSLLFFAYIHYISITLSVIIALHILIRDSLSSSVTWKTIAKVLVALIVAAASLYGKAKSDHMRRALIPSIDSVIWQGYIIFPTKNNIPTRICQESNCVDVQAFPADSKVSKIDGISWRNHIHHTYRTGFLCAAGDKLAANNQCYHVAPIGAVIPRILPASTNWEVP